MAKPVKHVFICTQGRPPGHPRGSCAANNSVVLYQEFMQQFEKRGLWGKYSLTSTGCMGPCDHGPNVLVYPEGVMYGAVSKDDVNAIIEEHLLQDKPVDRLKLPTDIW